MPLQIIGQSPLPLERLASMRTRASACVRACVRRAQGSADSGTLRASCMYIYIASRGSAPPKKPLSLGLVYTSLLRLSFPLLSSRKKRLATRRNLVSRILSDFQGMETRASNAWKCSFSRR